MHRFRFFVRCCGSRREHLVLFALLATGLAPILGVARQAAVLDAPPTATVAGNDANRQAVRRTLAAMPLVFEENVGQAPEGIRFLARGGGYALGLSGVETTFSLRSPAPAVTSPDQSAIRNPRYALVKTRLIGANPHAKTRGEKRLAAKINYFLGNQPEKWHTDVPAYERVRAAGVYPGIDVVHYGQQSGALEYDFEVAPGADPRDIRFAMDGAEKVALAANGDLVVTTAGGELRQRRPVCYQETQGRRVPVEGAFILADIAAAPDTQHPTSNTHEVSFRFGTYDHRRPLVIDPVLVYSTYLGGAGDDRGRGIAVDRSGRPYVTGFTVSTDFPTTAGSYQGVQGGEDAFVAVLDPAQSGAASLVYATYLGGSGAAWDEGWGIAVDAGGLAYVTGQTGSTDFPTTPGSYQGDPDDGGRWDAFVAVLDPAQSGASSLVYATYLGGGLDDGGKGIAVDGSGRAYVTGETYSSPDFPTTAGHYQGVQGLGDAFVAVVDPALNGAASLVYSTYLGGSGDWDGGFGIAVDGSGRACVTGTTASANFPTTAGKYQGDQGSTDAFVAVVDPAQSGAASLVYSSYLGGTGTDQGWGIAVDGSERACVTGYTASANFPTTAGNYQGDQGGVDAFVAVVDPSQSGVASLALCTYLGGAGADLGSGIGLDASGRAYVTGWTDSTNFPTTAGSYQGDPGDSNWDAIVAVLDPSQSGAPSLVYATYLGGGGDDRGKGIAVDGSGRAHVTGDTPSTDFPTTAGKFQGDPGDGNWDAFVAVLDPQQSTDPTNLIATAVSSTKINLAWVDNSGSEDGFKIERKTGSGSFGQIVTVGPNVTGYSNAFLMPNTEYTYRVRAYQGSTNSGYAVSSPVTTPPLPADPSNLTATPVTSTRINLTWTDNATDETGYKIEKKTGSGGTFGQISTAAVNATSYANIFLNPNTEYTYRVRAYRGPDHSGYATSSPVTTPPLPEAPTDLTATVVSSTRIDLVWTDHSGDETGFFVERKVGAASFFLINKVGANVTTYVSGFLQPNTQYMYRVRAYRGPDNSAYATSTPVTTLPLPAAPANVTATAVSRTQVMLTWTDVATDETGYKIEKKTGTGAFIHFVSVGANVSSYTNNFLTPNTQYQYRVRAYRGPDHSAYGTSNAVTTPP